MIYLELWLLVLGVSVAQAASITQTTEGWCSPAIGQTHGNVTLNCGLDPKVERRLNELLDKKDLELQEKIREAEEWTRKYHDLSQRLAEAGQDSELARQAEALLKEGKLEEVGALLDRLIESGEERIASYHCDRAQIFALQFKPIEALQHYEKAYRYRPSNLEYAHAYAAALHHQNRHAEAEPIYQANLKALRELAETTPSTYLPGIATTLNALAVLYLQTQRFKEAEDALQEGLTIYRQLAQANPSAYLPRIAMILNSLAFLYSAPHLSHLYSSDPQRLKKAEDALQEGLTIYRQLAQANPSAYLPRIAMIRDSLAFLYSQTQRFKEAEDALQEGLTIYRQLAQANPPAYLFDVTITLHNLGVFYHRTQRFKEAENPLREALLTRRQLGQANPTVYLPGIATTLNALAVLYNDTQRFKEAEEAYQEALTIRRQLAQTSPRAYLPNVALTFHNLGDFYHKTQRFKEAEKAYQEALTTYRQLAEANPPVYLPNVAETLKELAFLSLIQDEITSAQAWIEEALIINRDLWRTYPTAHGDSLGKSLGVKVLLLKQIGTDEATVCELIQETMKVVDSDSLKEWAQKQMEVSCSSPVKRTP